MFIISDLVYQKKSIVSQLFLMRCSNENLNFSIKKAQNFPLSLDKVFCQWASSADVKKISITLSDNVSSNIILAVDEKNAMKIFYRNNESMCKYIYIHFLSILYGWNVCLRVLIFENYFDWILLQEAYPLDVQMFT